MSKERRQHERLPVDLLFQYEISELPDGYEGELEKLETPIIKDISIGGVRIDSAQQLPKGLVLKVSIMPMLVPGLMHITGMVVWTEDRGAKGSVCGIQFIAFEEGSQEVFDNYLKVLGATNEEDLEKLRKEADSMDEF